MRAFSCLLFCLLTGILGAQNVLTGDTIYRTLTALQADSLIDANLTNPDFVILDVRTPSEYAGGHLINAQNINYYDANFSSQIGALDHSRMYLLYCAGGSRSTATFNLMQSLHFKEVYNLSGGISGWIAAGYPTTTTTGAEEPVLASGGIRTWPNPVSQFLHISSGPEQSSNLVILSPSGSVLFNSWIRGSQTIDMSSFASGQYVLVLHNGQTSFSKFIIKQ